MPYLLFHVRASTVPILCLPAQVFRHLTSVRNCGESELVRSHRQNVSLRNSVTCDRRASFHTSAISLVTRLQTPKNAECWTRRRGGARKSVKRAMRRKFGATGHPPPPPPPPNALQSRNLLTRAVLGRFFLRLWSHITSHWWCCAVSSTLPPIARLIEKVRSLCLSQSTQLAKNSFRHTTSHNAFATTTPAGFGVNCEACHLQKCCVCQFSGVCLHRIRYRVCADTVILQADRRRLCGPVVLELLRSHQQVLGAHYPAQVAGRVASNV
jgi:hypothetical protein